MRRLLVIPLILLGFTCAVAIGSNGDRSGKNSSVAGTISVLGSTSITVHSVFDVTCAVTRHSPKLGDYAVGDHVKIRCENGALTRVKNAIRFAHAPDSSTLANAEHATTTTPGTTSTASGVGTISAFSTSSSTITVTGDRSLTCTIGASSPGLGGYRAGDHVKIGCVNGVLYGIARIGSEPEHPTSTTTPTTNTYGFGTISALSPTSIAVTGDHNLTCSVGSSSPGLGDYHVGDHVKIGCQNGVLIGIARFGTTMTTTTTTTPVAYSYATGTLTAFSSSSITVTGDGAPLTCPIGPDAQSLTEFHVGDKVRMYCQNGTFYKLIRTETTTTPPPTPTPVTYSYSYGTGTITTLSADRITVTGDAVLSCTLSSTSPSVTAYHLGDKVKMYCQGGALYALIRS